MIEQRGDSRHPHEPLSETLYTFEVRGSTKYSLQLVTNDTLFRVNYDKPSLGISLRVKPLDMENWDVYGSVDPDTIQNLGIPISTPRQGAFPPEIHEGDVKRIRNQYGKLEDIQENLWNFEAVLPVRNLYTFFDAVWRPNANRQFTPWEMPKYDLGNSTRDYRIIPQKENIGMGKGQNKSAILLVQTLYRPE